MKRDRNRAAARPPILERFQRRPRPAPPIVIGEQLEIVDDDSRGYDPYDNPGPPPDPETRERRRQAARSG